MTGDQREGRANIRLWSVCAVFLLGWVLYSRGFFWQRPILNFSEWIVANSALLAIATTGLAWLTRDRWWPGLMRQLEAHTDAIDGLPLKRIGLWIALAAGVGLFTELMIIRLHSSYIQLFAYFKNVSLLSCFLGLGIGYTLGTRRPLLTPFVLPMVAFQTVFMQFLRNAGLDERLQSPVSEELAFGVRIGEGHHLVAVYGFLLMIFVFNALAFLPLGQLASRLMSRIPKLNAYSWNLIGSLAGILAFMLLSSLWAPPTIWLLVASLGLLGFTSHRRETMAVTAVSALAVVGVLAIPSGKHELDVYSPYQQLTLRFNRGDSPEIRVNHVYYQRILPLDSASRAQDEELADWGQHYDLPYHFQPAPPKVLVVGAGTGNDVAAAVRGGAGEIDAVEIDPAILFFGRQLHPEQPYSAPNVNEIVGDARNFIRHSDDQYDLIVYGLLDSHTLLSGKAGVRLDSYVYTVEAFREARARLTDTGLISLTFSLIKPELGRKLYLMLSEAFDGQNPVVYRTEYDNGSTFLIGENMAQRDFALHPALEDATEEVATADLAVDLSTDDWPFFYMPAKKFPSSYAAMIALLLVTSLFLIRQITPGAGRSTSAPCFFLGAGFMLVETKGITELALVYGSTWYVIGIVISGILVMAFLANLVVLRFGAPRPVVTYGLLFLSLALGLYVNSQFLAGLSSALSGAVLTATLTLPLFFSGFAFSTELGRAPSVAVALSSNLLGAMLGGFLEYNAMYLGFGSLYLLAFGMYAFAFLGALRSQTRTAPQPAAEPAAEPATGSI